MAKLKERDLDPVVVELLNETKLGEDEHRARCKRFDKSYEVYRATAPRPPGLEPYRSNLRVKYAMQVIDTAMVNMAQGIPRCKVLPRSAHYIDGSKSFQRVMDYFASEDEVARKVPVTDQQALIYGVTGGKTDWLYKTGKATVPVRDPNTGALLGAHTEDTVLRDGPSFTPWDVYELWWDPNGTSVDDCEYVALGSWLSKNYLEANRCSKEGSHELWECDGLYHNLDALYQSGTASRRPTSAQDRVTGGDQNLRKDRFHVVEYWRDDKLTVVGNKQVLLRDIPNVHWHGQKPVAIATCRPDLHKILGIPETELVDDLQQALWAIENLRQDNIHLTVWRGFTVRDTIGTDLDAIEIKPRALIPVSDHDDLKPIEVPPLPREAYEEEQVLLQRMQDVTGITPYISGAALGTVNQNTATGVSILNSAASVLLRFKAMQVQQGIWGRVFDQWGNDVQQFLERDISVRIVGPGGDVSFVDVGPQDVVGEYDFILEGTEESLSKAQEKQDALQFLTAFMPAIQAQLVNPRPIYERVANAFGIDDPESLFLPPPQPAAAAAPMPNGGTPQNGAGPGQTLTNGMPLPLGVQELVRGGGG